MSDARDFLTRWSERKRAARRVVATPAAVQPPATLPALESLTSESDFRDFMHAKVDEAVRRAALRTLFSDPCFNVMDGLDIYIGDYSVEDPIPAAMLAGLEHVRTTLLEPEKAQDPEEGTDAAA